MSRTEPFKTAMDYIANRNFSYKQTAVELAKKYPKAFCDAVDKVSNDTWKAVAVSYLYAGKKIATIKEVKDATGLSLKEAKEAVEHFQDHGYWEAI